MTRMTTMTALAMILVAGTAGAETLRFGYAQNAAPTVEAMQKFGELVEEKTGGDLTVQFFPDSQLGGEREMVEMLQGGALDMTKVSAGLMESFGPLYGIFAMPYLFDSQDHYYKALDDASIMQTVYDFDARTGCCRADLLQFGRAQFLHHQGAGEISG